MDLRIWRVLLLGVPLALVVGMFSLDDFPAARDAQIAPDAFEASTAESLAARLASVAPEPRPGSEADAQVADIAESRFKAIQGALLAEQRFDAEFEGESVELRNVLAILPGASQRQLVVLAHRDSARGAGAASSLAATAVLLEIASSFSGADHERTLVFVSADGGSIGAEGAKRFASDYTEIELVDAVIVISHPAAADPKPPFVITTSTGPEDTAAQLERTAADNVAREAAGAITDPTGEGAAGAAEPEGGEEEPAPDELREVVLDHGFVRELFTLALPAGIGGQAPLIGSGLDAVRISSRGELPAAPAADDADSVEPLTLERFGRASLALLLALDQTPGPLEEGPPAHFDLAGSMLPGWALAMIALAALLAPLVASLEAVGRLAARPDQAALAVLWVLARALPFASVLLVIWLLALVGLIGAPPFPFDPATQSAGALGWLLGAGLVALVATGLAVVPRVTRPLLPPTDLAAPTAVLLVSVAIGLAWIWNPYLALVLVAMPNAWAWAADPNAGALRRYGLLAAGFVPLALAFGDLAERFGTSLGPGFAWDVLMLRTSEQLSLGTSVLFCVIAGGAVALARPPRLIAPEPELRVSAPGRPGPGAGPDHEPTELEAEAASAEGGSDAETSEAPSARASAIRQRPIGSMRRAVAAVLRRRSTRRRRSRVREARRRAARRSIAEIGGSPGDREGAEAEPERAEAEPERGDRRGDDAG